MHEVEHIQKYGRNRNGSVCPAPALFEAFKYQHPGFQIHAVRGERQGFRYPAPGIGERAAECSHLACCVVGGFEKGIPLARREIFALAFVAVQIHGHRLRHSVLNKSRDFRSRLPESGAERNAETQAGISFRERVPARNF